MLNKAFNFLNKKISNSYNEKRNYPSFLEGYVFIAPHWFDRVLIFDSTQRKALEFQSVQLIHQALYDQSRNLVFGIPRMGKSVHVYDIKAQKEVKNIFSSKDSYFYGHGAISSDGSRIVFVEVSQPTADGYISVWNLNTLSLIKRLPTGDISPHDCYFDRTNENILYVVNGGNIPNTWDIMDKGFSFKMQKGGSLSQINLSTGETDILSKFGMEFDSPGHVSFGADSICVLTAAADMRYPCHVFIKSKDHLFQKAEFPKSVNNPRGQSLSVAYDPKQSLYIVTHPEGELVSFWSAHNGKCIKVIPINARGVVVPKPGYALLNSTLNSRALLINTINWEISILDSFKLGNGPHITMSPSQCVSL